MDMRVFWAVLAAFAVAGVAWLGFERYQEYRLAVAMQDAMTQMAEIPAKAAREAAQAAEVRQQRQAAMQLQDMIQRTLATDEQCIGGTVIKVDGSTYVQVLGADGRPEACEGRMRFRAR